MCTNYRPPQYTRHPIVLIGPLTLYFIQILFWPINSDKNFALRLISLLINITKALKSTARPQRICLKLRLGTVELLMFGSDLLLISLCSRLEGTKPNEFVSPCQDCHVMLTDAVLRHKNIFKKIQTPAGRKVI